jgi:hypothetical protein
MDASDHSTPAIYRSGSSREANNRFHVRTQTHSRRCRRRIEGVRPISRRRCRHTCSMPASYPTLKNPGASALPAGGRRGVPSAGSDVRRNLPVAVEDVDQRISRGYKRTGTRHVKSAKTLVAQKSIFSRTPVRIVVSTIFVLGSTICISPERLHHGVRLAL